MFYTWIMELIDTLKMDTELYENHYQLFLSDFYRKPKNEVLRTIRWFTSGYQCTD